MIQLTPHQKSALEFENHLSLTANAGSGKTFVLARRYLNAALKDGVNISNIAAITFTDKASGELYSKIVKLINEQISASKSEIQKQKLEKIRRQLVSAYVSTIHSFCINILREFPVEADLDARFIPIDERLSDELIELSILEVVKYLLEDESYSKSIKYLIRMFGSKSRLEAETFDLIKQRKNLLTIKEAIYKNDEKGIAKHFQTQFDAYYSQIWNENKLNLIESIYRINKTVLSKNSQNEYAFIISALLKKYDKLKSSDQILKFVSDISDALLTGKGSIKIRGYLSNDLRDGLENEIQIIESTLSDLSKIEYSPESDKLLKELAKFGKILLEVFDHTLTEYENKKNAEGFLDYEDILLHTKEILKKENVQKSLSDKFKYILVDEYQDTNEIQYEIFLPILDYLKVGNLFIVGDEKQSIYMFRDAELEIFNRTKKDISSVSGNNSLLELPDSFRMAPAICLFSNRLFENLFAKPNEMYNEVANTNIVCARTDNKPGEIEFLLSSPNSENNISEAELVARRIINLGIKGVEYKSIAILVRKRKSFAELETEFIKYGIPFAIIGGRGFYQRQTISDVYNYLSFLSNSGNSTALVGVLRSPFFSVSDSILFEISLKTGEKFWDKLKQYSFENKKINQIKNLLEENLQVASSLELTVLLKKILTDTEYLAVIASRNDGDQELANIDKLIEISRRFSLKGFRNLYDFLDHLKDAITGIEDESQAAVTSDSNAVQLMTLHQAKGLEFPVVILFKTHESSQKTLIKSKQVSISKNFGILTKLPLNEDYLGDYHSTPINGLYNFIEEKKRIAELKRLLYVGITRAIDHLIISGELGDEQKLKSDSFLYLIKSGLNINFSNENFLLEDELVFLKLNNGNYSNSSKKIKIQVPIQFIISTDKKYKPPVQERLKDLIVNINALTPPLEKDIISAIKVAVYNQCPTKYLLTYEYGFALINSLTRESKNQKYELVSNFPEEENYYNEELRFSKIPSNVKGTLIHSLLEREISPNDLDDKIAKYFSKNGLEGKSLIQNKKEVIAELQKFFNSGIYKEINSYEKYKNEFEAYLKDEEIFLYGIIDKIIFTDDKLIIVDYKSDDIPAEEVEERAENYLIQLKFYLYIAQKLFPSYSLFQLLLIFTKHPEKPVIKNFDTNGLFLVKKEISDIIKGIIHKNFYKNTEHCGICVYSDVNKKCKMN